MTTVRSIRSLTSGVCAALQICEDAGNMTTVRSIEPPYAYNTRERRRAAKARAATFAALLEGGDLREAAPSCAWPGGWQSRIKQDGHKARARLTPQKRMQCYPLRLARRLAEPHQAGRAQGARSPDPSKPHAVLSIAPGPAAGRAASSRTSTRRVLPASSHARVPANSISACLPTLSSARLPTLLSARLPALMRPHLPILIHNNPTSSALVMVRQWMKVAGCSCACFNALHAVIGLDEWCHWRHTCLGSCLRLCVDPGGLFKTHRRAELLWFAGAAGGRQQREHG